MLSDVEIIDDYPSHFRAHSRRKHRWIRGDWQILRWLFPRVPDSEGNLIKNPLKFVSRWKILDNLRRSVTETATFVLLLASWFFLPGPASYWTAATVTLMLAPRYTQLVFSLLRLENTGDTFSHVKQILGDFVTGQVNVLIFFTFLAHQTLVTMDAIFRTVVRLTVTHRNLLEWETAAQSEMETKKKTPVDVYLDWTPLVTLLIGGLLAEFRPHALLAAAPILVLWLFSKPIARWLDRPLVSGRSEITTADETFLRKVALRTWRFFRAFSTAGDQWLIPDNVQGEAVRDSASHFAHQPWLATEFAVCRLRSGIHHAHALSRRSRQKFSFREIPAELQRALHELVRHENVDSVAAIFCVQRG